jgi:hypothetical protein
VPPIAVGVGWGRGDVVGGRVEILLDRINELTELSYLVEVHRSTCQQKQELVCTIQYGRCVKLTFDT